MPRKSSLMLTNTTGKFEVTSDPIRADSYYGFTDGLHTISIHMSNFTGRIRIQGTLALSPNEHDWFDIDLHGMNCDNDQYLQFPRDPDNPTSTADGAYVGDTGVEAFTFVGNFVYLRVKIERSYLGEININEVNLGTIDKVLLSL